MTYIKRCVLIVMGTVAACLAATAVRAGEKPRGACPMEKIGAERLPDLNIARAGHQVVFVGGELMVVGGHTDGFVPTATAEFLRQGDSQWRVQPTTYTHDFGMALPLASGQVLMAGGAAESLGIGLTHCVERYDPESHEFTGFGCLDTKRMYQQGACLADGNVVIAGNWYHDDAIELFDGEKQFSPVKTLPTGRACPYLFPIGPDDAIVFGDLGTRGQVTSDHPTRVDRLRGEAFDAPLLRDWQPIRLMTPHLADDSFIGDAEKGDWRYLVAMEDRAGNLRIGLVSDTVFALLPTLGPLPTTGPDGRRIIYTSTVVVDRRAGRGYVWGHDTLPEMPRTGCTAWVDTLCRQYVYAFDYVRAVEGTVRDVKADVPAEILYYTDSVPGIGLTTPVLTPEGDLVLVAGTCTDNFAPFSGAWRLLTGRHDDVAAAEASVLWPWMALIVVATGVTATAWLLHRRRRVLSVGATWQVDDPTDADAADTAATSDLMDDIRALMEQERVYLNSRLTIADVAARLGVHRNVVSQCINTQAGCSFSQYVARYRVDHAKQLLSHNPDMKVSAVCDESGFSTESSFFRAFKAVTGTTPREWVASQP